MKAWRWRPPIYRRVSDGSLWTGAYELPYPLDGFYLARVTKAFVGWWVHPAGKLFTRCPLCVNPDFEAKDTP
jgi:hypothetical protein